MRHRIWSGLAAVMLLCGVVLSLPACKNEDVIGASYKTLKIAADTYGAAMKSAAELYREGRLDEEGKARAIAIGTKFAAAHRAASSALEAYAVSARAEDKAKLDTALSEVTRLVGELTEIVRPFVVNNHPHPDPLPEGEGTQE